MHLHNICLIKQLKFPIVILTTLSIGFPGAFCVIQLSAQAAKPLDTKSSTSSKTIVPKNQLGKIATAIERLRIRGDSILNKKQYEQAFQIYEEARELVAKFDLEQKGCPSSFSPGSTTSLNKKNSSSDTLTERILLASLYELGSSYFKLAYASTKASKTDLSKDALDGAESVLTKLASRLSVFSSGKDQDPNSKISCSSVSLIGIDDVLEAGTYRLLQQVHLAQNQYNDALLAADAWRTIEVDKSIAYNLFQRRPVDRTARISVVDVIDRVARELSSNQVTIERVRRIANEKNVTLVSYSTDSTFSPEKIFIWVVRPQDEDIKFVTTVLDDNTRTIFEDELQQVDPSDPRKSALAQIVRSTRETLTTDKSTLASQAGLSIEEQEKKKLKQLYQLLIQPIKDFLPKDSKKQVIFIPHGPISFVPFPALQDPSGKYLIDQHTITTAASIRTLYLTLAHAKTILSPGNVLVVGNPATKLGVPLPGAESEAKQISSLFEKREWTVNKYVGGTITKEDILPKLDRAKIIHLATHGTLNVSVETTKSRSSSTSDVREIIKRQLDFMRYKPAAGAIALSPKGKDNGLLTAHDLLNMRLNANLVVLSACDTGRGPLTAGGVIGLPLSLNLAGVPNVIVSLWAVPDAPTAELMTAFYQRLLTDKNTNKAKALREAMLTIKSKKKYRDPKNWAAFTLVGLGD